MSEMLQYIFGTMTEAEKALGQMQKIVKKARTTSRKSFALSVIGAGIAVASYIHVKQLEERVEALEETIRSMTEYDDEETEDEEVQ